MSEHPLNGLHALVTGGGSGIGAATARRLSRAGARVTVLGRDRTKLDAVAGEVGVAVAADVADAAAVAAAFAEARDRHGPIDILVNNAGAARSAPFKATTPELWAEMLGVNLTGAYLCAREVLPAMAERGFGRVVNVASTAGLKGYAYVSAYVAAKHGLVGLTRALAVEYAKTGVAVSAVCPGFTDTDLVARSVETIAAKTGRSPDAARAELAAANPQGRLITPDEVASAIAWLCLPENGAANGAILPVAGGEV
jgi:NAD(P)-dependent dehydrogenase (short-subunit alcohol dehydrogenase family)